MSFPQGSTAERHETETQQIAQVFGLTGGELEAEVWTEGDVLSHWWYQGVPDYATSDFSDAYAMDVEYRTMVRDCMFGFPPEKLGEWERVAYFANSGETECCANEEGTRCKDTSCILCEGDGFIYIGDGWHEVVYRREVPDEG